jgi:GGDEF domain-containing protein
VIVWSKVLSIALFIMITLIFLPLIYHFDVALQPTTKQAYDGQISIQPSDFPQRKTLALAGDWSLFWQQLLEPEQVKLSIKKPALIKGIGGWESGEYKVDYKAVGFIMCQSFVTNSRFNHLINHNETLTGRLKERNADLVFISELLETKVEQRTRQLKLANKERKSLANNDSLTNTYNRHESQQYIQSAFERFRRTQEPFSMVLVDYDHFKEINDNYGHDVGDIVLVAGAELIKNGIREQDKLARWKGKKFFILLPDTVLEGTLVIASQLQDSISANPIG